MLSSNGSYFYKRLTASGLLKSGSGLLGGFIVASGTPTITIYDNNAGSGTLILNGLLANSSTPYPVPARFTNGAYVVISGTGDVTFFYE